MRVLKAAAQCSMSLIIQRASELTKLSHAGSGETQKAQSQQLSFQQKGQDILMVWS